MPSYSPSGKTNSDRASPCRSRQTIAAYEAAQYLHKILAIDKNTNRSLRTRFLSLYNLPKAATRKVKGEDVQYSPLDDMVKVLLFAVNQVNRVNTPATLIKVSDDLFAIELDSPGWSAAAWESLAANDPYFRPEWIEDATWNWLTSYTQSQYPIMRTDQFVTLATQAPNYYELLGLPKTRDELFKLLGIDESLLSQFKQNQRQRQDGQPNRHPQQPDS